MIAWLSALGACTGASVSVPSKFPVPLVSTMPLSMGLVLNSELINYTHEEQQQNNGTWRIGIGSAQQPMFESLFTGLFADYQLVESTADQAAELDAIVVPSISQMQFATPTQTGTTYYEVWIRYQIKLYDNETLVTEWPITAYGKANVKNYGLTATQPALKAAALAACRDAMAFFAVEFGSEPKIKQWLTTRNNKQLTPEVKAASL